MWYKMCSRYVSRQFCINKLKANTLVGLLRSVPVFKKNTTYGGQVITKVNVYSTTVFISKPQLVLYRSHMYNEENPKSSTRDSFTKLLSGTVLFGVLVYSEFKSAECISMDEQKIVEHVDLLYDSNKMQEALKYLESHSESTSAEVLWRLARLCYKVGKYHTSNNEEARKLATKGMKYAQRALDSDDENFACHKWIGILISWSSEFEGYKRKIERSFEIKDHFLKAIELSPNDPTCRHLLGQWCYSVSSVPWYHRKVASVIFATPPSSTFEEALSHFEAAEKVEPGFYSTNWLYLGKCHLQLGRIKEGCRWLRKAAEYQSEVGDDKEAKKEAKALLVKLGEA